MKSTADIFNNNELTTEAIKKMLETCDDSSEYIKGDMIYCRKCNKPRRKWMPAFGAYVPVMCSGTILDPNTFEHVMAMSTRYGFFALTNPANSLGNAADYLARIKVANLRFI